MISLSLSIALSWWSWTRIIPVIRLLYFVSLFLFLSLFPSPLCVKCRNLLEDIRRTSKIKWTSEHPQVDHQTHQKPSAAICFSYCRWLELPSPPSSMMGSRATSSGFPWQLPSPSACSLELAPYILLKQSWVGCDPKGVKIVTITTYIKRQSNYYPTGQTELTDSNGQQLPSTQRRPATNSSSLWTPDASAPQFCRPDTKPNKPDLPGISNQTMPIPTPT